MFADSGAKPPPGIGTARPEQVVDAVISAIERDRVEVTVAPLRVRSMTYLAMINPSLSVRIQSAAIGQKAATTIAEGHARGDKR
jgi:hypothetical protein